MPKPLPFASIQNILKGLIKDYGMEGHMAEHRLRAEWPDLVGKAVALHSRPGQIRFHKLYLSVDSPGWMQELNFLKPALLKKVNDALVRNQSGFTVKEIILKMEAFPGGEGSSPGTSGASPVSP
ncbi:MAG TPA: DUF721 domain-containing protein [Nitrospiria bacterium]|nr:DUF721 domain-containing protein [Nitrospiria bacterium]